MILDLFRPDSGQQPFFVETRKKSQDNGYLFNQVANYLRTNQAWLDGVLHGGLHGSAYVIQTTDGRWFRCVEYCRNFRTGEESFSLWRSTLATFANDAGFTWAELMDNRLVASDNTAYDLDNECVIFTAISKPRRRKKKVGGKKKWGKSVAQKARQLLRELSGEFHELRVHDFHDDEDAHDDDFQHQVEQSFVESFDVLIETLGIEFGQPVESGEADHDSIPLTGVFKFACWHVGENTLYAAAAHEDREAPFLLFIGASNNK